MYRTWISVIVVGSLLTCSAALAAKPSKALQEVKAAREQANAQREATFGKRNGPPVTHENAANQIRFKAPSDWKPTAGGCAGSLFNLLIAPDFGSLPAGRDGETVTIYGDIFTVAANPVKSPGADLDDAVADVKAELTKGHPKAEFKPVAKSKVAGVEARVVVATIPGKEKDEPKKVERHVVLLRGDKVYQLILYSHVNTAAKQTKQVDAIVKSFEWTGQPATRPAAAPVAAAPAKPAEAKPAAAKPADAPEPAARPAAQKDAATAPKSSSEGDGLE